MEDAKKYSAKGSKFQAERLGGRRRVSAEHNPMATHTLYLLYLGRSKQSVEYHTTVAARLKPIRLRLTGAAIPKQIQAADAGWVG